MCAVTVSLTIIFDPPYYKGIFEVTRNKSYSIAEINLGTSEPKLPSIQNLILKRWAAIHFFTKESENGIKNVRVNPKRLQRLAKKSIKKGIGTSAQATLKEQLHEKKKVKKSERSAKEQTAKRIKFSIKHGVSLKTWTRFLLRYNRRRRITHDAKIYPGISAINQ